MDVDVGGSKGNLDDIEAEGNGNEDAANEPTTPPLPAPPPFPDTLPPLRPAALTPTPLDEFPEQFDDDEAEKREHDDDEDDE